MTTNYNELDLTGNKFSKQQLDSLQKDRLDPTQSYAKVLLYGKPGSTKTVEAFSVGDRVCGIQSDPGGFESLRNHPELGLLTGRIDLYDYKGLSQLEAIAQAANEKHGKFAEYDTYVVDTASNIITLDLDVITKVQIEKKSRLEESKRFDFEAHMRGVYNQDAYRARVAFLKLFNVKANVIATAHVRYYRDKHNPDIIVSVGPKFPPEVMSSIASFTTLVGYMKADAKISKDRTQVRYVRTMQVHPTEDVEAKTRIGNLPLVIPNPNLRKIIQDWKEAGGLLVEDAEPVEQNPVKDLTPEELEDFGLGK